MLLVFDKWMSFESKIVDAEGKKIMMKVAPLTRKEKGIVVTIISGFILMLITLLAIFNPSWLERLREKLNGKAGT